MFWPDTQTGVDVEPARKTVQSAVRKYFTEGGVGVPPTVPGGDWFNQITNELLNVLVAAGIDPSKADDDQLLEAIKRVSNSTTAREAMRRSYAEAGYTLVEGSFEVGGTLTSTNTVLLYEANGQAYAWTGAYPAGGLDVAAKTSPASDTRFVSMASELLLDQLGAFSVVSINDALVPTSRICVHHFGSNDDPASWISAMQYCSLNGHTLHVVGDVALTDIAKFVMPDNTRLVVDWTDCRKFTVLDAGDWEKLVITSEKYAEQDGCYVQFVGSTNVIGTGVAHWGENNDGMRKNIPIRIQANTVKIEKYDCRSIWGFGLRIFNARDVEIDSFNAEEIGGHSSSYLPDDFGDGIYFGGLHGDVQIKIGVRKITGMVGLEGSTVSRGLSRAGFAFENSTNLGECDIDLKLIGGEISNFERTVHAEGVGNLTVLWDANPVIKNSGVLLHRFNPVGSYFTYAIINDCEYHQKENHKFGSDYGIGGGCYATLNGGSFFGLGKPFDIDSDVNSTPSAAHWVFNGADLFMNNSRLQFRYGSCDVTGGRVVNHGPQQQNADGSAVTFKSVNFDISLSELDGTQISPAAKDVFVGCILNNQTFHRANIFDACVYRNDIGISISNGIRVTSHLQKIPKIPLSIYRITALDTAVEYVNTVFENGSIVGGKLVDNGDGTLSVHSSVQLHAVVSIQWFK